MDPDARADLEAVQAQLNAGAIVALHHLDGDQRAALFNDLAAVLCAAAVSCAHAATAREADR